MTPSFFQCTSPPLPTQSEEGAEEAPEGGDVGDLHQAPQDHHPHRKQEGTGDGVQNFQNQHVIGVPEQIETCNRTNFKDLDHRQQNTLYPQWHLLAHFEAALDFSSSEFTCP